MTVKESCPSGIGKDLMGNGLKVGVSNLVHNVTEKSSRFHGNARVITVKIVTVSLAVRSAEDAEQFADELYNDLLDMYRESNEVTLLKASVSDPTKSDLELLALRSGDGPEAATT